MAQDSKKMWDPNRTGGLFAQNPVLSDHEFRALRDLIHDRFGINLTEQKRSLLAGRLQKLLRRYNLTTFRDYYKYVVADTSGQALIELVDRVSTNHTSFFREPAHFEFLRQTALPEIINAHRRRRNRDLRIWCAGCATGEEAYSLMMTLMETLGDEYSAWDAGLLATDISGEALDVAKTGVYSTERIQSIPIALVNKYLTKVDDGNWVMKLRIRREITFRRFNLMNQTFPFRRPFDMIFCRNVMIYFDQPTKRELTHKLAALTVPEGYLFVGHSESLERNGCPYDYIMPAVYRLGSER